MFKYLIAISLMFLFNGCSGHCISLFDDTCVIEREVPGPTKLVYESCKMDNIPDEPVWKPTPISFKRITFDDQLFYGITEDEAVTLDVNMIRDRAYKKTLRATILKYTKEETK